MTSQEAPQSRSLTQGGEAFYLTQMQQVKARHVASGIVPMSADVQKWRGTNLASLTLPRQLPLRWLNSLTLQELLELL